MQLQTWIEHFNSWALSATPLAREQPGTGSAQRYRPVAARFLRAHLGSRFQPIFALDTHRAMGHEALLRASSADGPMAGQDVFAMSSGEELVDLDRLCRVIHALNPVAQDTQGLLFLNVHPQLLATVTDNHGKVFEEMLRICRLTTSRVVLEIAVNAMDDEIRLADAISTYRCRGYKIALCNAGCRQSSFSRVNRLWPEVLKLDRSLIAVAESCRATRSHLALFISMLHAFMGIDVVVEGIETAGQARIAADLGADLVQGNYYGRPSIETVTGPPLRLEDLAMLAWAI